MALPRILFVFGTRPECIKLAPLIIEAKKRLPFVMTCFTGQHQEMAQPVLDYFQIKPDYLLNIMRSNQTLTDISQSLHEKLPGVLTDAKPDYVIVQGDTSTAAMSANIAFYQKIKVAHVEAGLRTHNLFSPWPEEFNRRIIGLAADIHFTPTLLASQNLLKENILPEKIHMVGNTGIDALRIVTENLPSTEKTNQQFNLLVTLHRRENFGIEMLSLMQAIKTICEQNPQIDVTWPLHQNPQVRKTFTDAFPTQPKNLHLTEPLDYFDFVQVMKKSDLIVTDSGGIQEEAPFLGKPILVCRKDSERIESIECGAARLIGTDPKELIRWVQLLCMKKAEYQAMAQVRTPYGDGYASSKIMDVLCR